MDISHGEPRVMPLHRTPPDSMSRTLDRMVQAQEMPYGYEGDGPSADTQDFNQERIESKKAYRKGSHG